MDFAVWVDAMRDNILQGIPESDWKATRALIVTSVGHEELVVMDGDTLARLQRPAHQTDRANESTD